MVVNEALTLISTEYFDCTDVFSPELASELFEHTKINDHAIELAND